MVVQGHISESRVQRPIIASGLQRSPDAYEVPSQVLYSAQLPLPPRRPMCCQLISIPLSLLQYYSHLVSVNGGELDIVDSLDKREFSGPESLQLKRTSDVT